MFCAEVTAASHSLLSSPLLYRPDEQVVPKEDPLAHEIADVLREWNIVWKRLYAVSGSF